MPAPAVEYQRRRRGTGRERGEPRPAVVEGEVLFILRARERKDAQQFETVLEGNLGDSVARGGTISEEKRPDGVKAA